MWLSQPDQPRHDVPGATGTHQMAAGDPRRPVGFSHCTHYRKDSPLKLGPEHVPFPCSLRELVLDRFGEPMGVGSHTHPMQLDELLGYLKNIDNYSLSPWVALTGQTEAIGDPATPSPEQVAILRWLGKALEIWEKQSPLEGRVASQVRRLKPLSAALAITDPEFLRPGAHPIHQLLDCIQTRAIGWQARLDRVGTILEQQITRAVDNSRLWFDNRSTNLSVICTEFSTAAERDQARASRMVQRVVEAEAGKIKTAAAKEEAARMINTALEKHPVPEEIGGFLKGPWYTSAQLVLLKYGADSEQWKKMSLTTGTLLDSFQNTEAADETRRQHIFEVVTRLPKEMRRWLLSLHHDTEAVNEAMGLVEFAHLRILRRQPLALLHITPIMVEGSHGDDDTERDPTTGRNWQKGQWFIIDSGNDGAVRAQLVLKVEQSQQLLFTNLAGIKALQLSFSEFERLIAKGKVKALYSGASFSLCLAQAVGIDSVEILDALASALSAAEPERYTETQSVASSSSAARPDSGSTIASAHGAKASPAQQTELEAELALEPDPEPELQAVSEPEDALEAELGLELEPELPIGPDPEPAENLDLQAMSEQLIRADLDPVGAPKARTKGQTPDPGEAESAISSKRQRRNDEQSGSQKPPSGEGFLVDQAEEIRARGGYFAQHPDALDQDDDHIEEIIPQPVDESASTGTLVDQAGYRDYPRVLSEGHTESLEPPPAEVEGVEGNQAAHVQPPEKADDSAVRREVKLPMGAWLGFHDGETPLMARLAVYDLENDHYIFVNRQGVKMRQVSRLELLHLIDNELVDILETRSNFREEVTEVRKNLDRE